MLRTILRAAAVLAFCAPGLQAQAKWRLVEDLRIGGGDEGPTSLSRIGGMDVDKQGRIAVFDQVAVELRLFDASGKFVRTVGRKGQGPGEYTEVNGIRYLANGTLWVNDYTNTRIVGFDAKGDFLRQHIVPVWGYGFRWDAVVDPQGRIAETFTFTSPGPSGARERKIRRLDTESGKLDTVDIPKCLPSDEPPGRWSRAFVSGRGRGFAGIPFAPTPSTRLDPFGGYACARGEEYRANVFNYSTGALVTDIRSNAAAVSIPDARRDSAVAAIYSRGGRFPVPPGTIGLSDVPATYPRIDQIDFDDAGRLWIRRETANGIALDVWGRDGKQIATIDAPVRFARFESLVIRGDRLYTVLTDADDVPFIVRYRIAR
jgi:hypothetical protein